MDSSERTEVTGRPTVSVVVPCYNIGRYVRKAVASAVAQTHQPLEVICVDDGSTDDTLHILCKLEAEHPNLVQVLTGPNRGAPAARNRGLAQARGEYVQFLDADDVLDRDKLEHQAVLIGTSSFQPDLIVAAFYSFGEGQEEREIEVGERSMWRNLVMSQMGITSANLFRRSAVEQVGGWDEGLPCSQEYDLMFRMLKRGARCLADRAPKTHIRTRSNSVGKVPEAFVTSMELRVRIMDYVRVGSLVNRVEQEEMYNYLFRWIRAHYATSPTEASDMYRRLIPRRFVPKPQGNTTRLYTWAYRVLGFQRAEALKRLVGRDC